MRIQFTVLFIYFTLLDTYDIRLRNVTRTLHGASSAYIVAKKWTWRFQDAKVPGGGGIDKRIRAPFSGLW